MKILFGVLATAFVGLCLIGVIAIVIGLAAGDTSVPAKAAKPEVTKTELKMPDEPAEPEMTSAQENAVESAQSYLDYSGFSEKGLIQQLSSAAGDGFPKADAIFAANHVDANWKAEAVESAQSYLDYSSFSRDGLIDQLSSSAGEGFTLAQAQYAVDQVY